MTPIFEFRYMRASGALTSKVDRASKAKITAAQREAEAETQGNKSLLAPASSLVLWNIGKYLYEHLVIIQTYKIQKDVCIEKLKIAQNRFFRIFPAVRRR